MAISSSLKVWTAIRIVRSAPGDVPRSGHLQNQIPTVNISVNFLFWGEYGFFASTLVTIQITPDTQGMFQKANICGAIFLLTISV